MAAHHQINREHQNDGKEPLDDRARHEQIMEERIAALMPLARIVECVLAMLLRRYLDTFRCRAEAPSKVKTVSATIARTVISPSVSNPGNRRG